MSRAYDAFVLKTVSEGPGLSLLDAAGAAGVTTVNDYRAIRLARDKAVAAVRARAAGIPFPKTWFASRSTLLEQIPADVYPLVVKPNNGSPEGRLPGGQPGELAELDIDDSGSLLAQPYLPNPGHDVKLYNTGDEVFATVKRSPLHPGADVVEEQIPVTPELRKLARAVGRVFGLDIYGIDVVETAGRLGRPGRQRLPQFRQGPRGRLAAGPHGAAGDPRAASGRRTRPPPPTATTFAPALEATA